MSYNYRTSKNLDRVLEKLLKKDKATYEQIISKIREIINSSDVEHYKNLRYDMKDSKRVHIGHFVLVFSYNKTRNFVSFEDYDHHGNIYNR